MKVIINQGLNLSNNDLQIINKENFLLMFSLFIYWFLFILYLFPKFWILIEFRINK